MIWSSWSLFKHHLSSNAPRAVLGRWGNHPKDRGDQPADGEAWGCGVNSSGFIEALGTQQAPMEDALWTLRILGYLHFRKPPNCDEQKETVETTNSTSTKLTTKWLHSRFSNTVYPTLQFHFFESMIEWCPIAILDYPTTKECGSKFAATNNGDLHHGLGIHSSKHQYSSIFNNKWWFNIHQYSSIFTKLHHILFVMFYGKISCLQSWLFHDPTVSPYEVNIRITFHQGNIMIQAGTFHHSNIFKSTWKPTNPTICYGIPSGWNIYEELFHWFQIKMIHPGVNEHSHGNHDYLGGFPTIHVNSSALLGGAVPVISGYGCIYNVRLYNQW